MTQGFTLKQLSLKVHLHSQRRNAKSRVVARFYLLPLTTQTSFAVKKSHKKNLKFPCWATYLDICNILVKSTIDKRHKLINKLDIISYSYNAIHSNTKIKSQSAITNPLIDSVFKTNRIG